MLEESPKTHIYRKSYYKYCLSFHHFSPMCKYGKKVKNIELFQNYCNWKRKKAIRLL